MRFLPLILLSSTLCYADTYRYIAFKEKFNEKTDGVVFDVSSKGQGEKALDEFGKKQQPQPSANTQFIVVKNTDVAILEVDFQDDQERTLFEKMNSDGRLFLFDVSRLVDDGTRRVERLVSLPLPVDINKDWTVKKSS